MGGLAPQVAFVTVTVTYTGNQSHVPSGIPPVKDAWDTVHQCLFPLVFLLVQGSLDICKLIASLLVYEETPGERRPWLCGEGQEITLHHKRTLILFGHKSAACMQGPEHEGETNYECFFLGLGELT